MQWLQTIYDRVLHLAGRPHASKWLMGVSASEAVFFPIPPDVMLIPMGLAQPDKVWRLALWCTLASIAGGVVGYLLGWWGSDALAAWMSESRWNDTYQQVQGLFETHGVWVLILAGFTPIPFKIFTITAGLLLLPLHWFLLAALVGRGARFFLVAALIALGGERLAERIRPLLSKLGWFVIAIAVVIVAWLIFNR